MRVAFVIAVPLGVLFTLFAWRLSQILSSDAIALALGLGFGVFAGVPSMALVAMARARDNEDYDNDRAAPVVVVLDSSGRCVPAGAQVIDMRPIEWSGYLLEDNSAPVDLRPALPAGFGRYLDDHEGVRHG